MLSKRYESTEVDRTTWLHISLLKLEISLLKLETTQLGALKTHKLVHSVVRPYKCDVCDYSTTQIGPLKTHKLIQERRSLQV